jgi:hypothetical protein
MKVDAPDQAIPKDALDSAECVAVFPDSWQRDAGSLSISKDSGKIAPSLIRIVPV